jgi:hypothetical protein
LDVLLFFDQSLQAMGFQLAGVFVVSYPVMALVGASFFVRVANELQVVLATLIAIGILCLFVCDIQQLQQFMLSTT